ncbi:transcription termination/antitermination protein NusG [Tautonia sociabilis]|uniref:Transcription termination/antitermination protein NusG n=1 Tax=Tautonia sociabilis TaxID=2080755 RepID=A0A432MN82_9BACT|nr:transcription termination/antitermination protein NusG [Tautonia sociabilis]RUL88760.1 transcription termination/antitermination factor NusG [Tautonia sociabilis]
MSTTPDEHDEPEPVPGAEPTEPGPTPEPDAGSAIGPSNLYEVEESAPDGGTPPGDVAGEDDEIGGEPEDAEPAASTAHARRDPARADAAEGEGAQEPDEPEVGIGIGEKDDDEPPPNLVWYVLKVQSGREDTIKAALERRVKIEALERYFDQIVVPKEKVTEIRNNKKRTVERKSYPGYIMVHMELNEKTWFVVRETPGVGDFVGAHGTPTPMSQAEIDKILKPEEPGESKAVPKIDLERGDRVKIKEGPFENFEGNVEEVIEARGLVKVMLIIFNRPTPVDLEYWQVERV